MVQVRGVIAVCIAVLLTTRSAAQSLGCCLEGRHKHYHIERSYFQPRTLQHAWVRDEPPRLRSDLNFEAAILRFGVELLGGAYLDARK